MKRVSAKITISENVEKVWKVWSDFANIDKFSASIARSYIIGDIKKGIGTKRRCEISENSLVEEEITNWVENKSYSMKITLSVGIPITKMEVDFNLNEMGKNSEAEIIMNYEFKGLLNFIPTKILMKKQAKDHLIGLKHFIETKEFVNPKNLKLIRKHYKTY